MIRMRCSSFQSPKRPHDAQQSEARFANNTHDEALVRNSSAQIQTRHGNLKYGLGIKRTAMSLECFDSEESADSIVGDDGLRRNSIVGEMGLPCGSFVIESCFLIFSSSPRDDSRSFSFFDLEKHIN